jgi:hypothetical protein
MLDQLIGSSAGKGTEAQQGGIVAQSRCALGFPKRLLPGSTYTGDFDDIAATSLLGCK